MNIRINTANNAKHRDRSRKLITTDYGSYNGDTRERPNNQNDPEVLRCLRSRIFTTFGDYKEIWRESITVRIHLCNCIPLFKWVIKVYSSLVKTFVTRVQVALPAKCQHRNLKNKNCHLLKEQLKYCKTRCLIWYYLHERDIWRLITNF